jgi:hypothetical protein
MQIGFLGLLTVLFVGLKLTSHIDWSWWWVLSPLWVGLVAALAVTLLGSVVVASVGLCSWWKHR